MSFSLPKSIAVLERTPNVLSNMLQNLPNEWVNCNEGTETWSAFDVIGHLIQGEALTELLGTAGVVNVRAYMGVDGTGTQKLMFVGVDASGNDLIDATHLIYDQTQPCPSCCDTNSPLFNP